MSEVWPVLPEPERFRLLLPLYLSRICRSYILAGAPGAACRLPVRDGRDERCLLGAGFSSSGFSLKRWVLSETGRMPDKLLLVRLARLLYSLNQAQDVTGPYHIWSSPRLCLRIARKSRPKVATKTENV